MFQLNAKELHDWRSQIATSNREKMGIRYPPFAFTEHGVLMLSSVLHSDRAIQVNLQIMRLFVKMREMVLKHKDILLKINEMEQKVCGHDEKIKLLFNYLKQFIEERKSPRQRIGFKTNTD